MLNYLLFSDPTPEEIAAQHATDLITTISIGVIAAMVLIVLVLSLANKKHSYNTKSIVYGGICIASSFVLSFIKISMGFGGSITLASMLPLFIYAYVFGIGKGLLAGIIYGLLQFIQDAWLLTIPQFLLDYILAFAGICLVGVFKKIMSKNASIFTGFALYSILRLFCHIGSGIIFYNSGYIANLPIFGAGEAFSSFVYSSFYNLLYMLPETAISFAVIGYLVGSKQFFTLEKFMLKAKESN